MSIASRLDRIFQRVHGSFTYVTDIKNWNRTEHWPTVEEVTDALNSGELYGDCDDFALACRSLCRLDELPARLLACWDETGGYHLVCEVEGYILDNRQDRALPRDSIVFEQYRWDRISGLEQGDEWRKVL